MTHKAVMVYMKAPGTTIGAISSRKRQRVFDLIYFFIIVYDYLKITLILYIFLLSFMIT